MYKPLFTKSFLKDLRKINKETQKLVVNKWIPALQENPFIGQKFTAKTLKPFHKISYRDKKNDYRIVYKVEKKQITIVLIAIGSRENFYKKLKV